MTGLLHFITALTARLPLSAALKIGAGLGWIYGSLVRYRRREARAALRRSFPEKDDRFFRATINGMYRNLGMNLIEMLRLAGGPLEEFNARIAVEGRANVDQALQRGKGVLILTAHFGNWDVLGMFTVRRGYPLTIISKDLKSKTINKLWMALREKIGVKIIPAHNAIRASLRALRQNELLGFILDQNRPREHGLFVDFFGRPACTSPGLAIIAAQAQAPVVPVFIHRTPEGNHLMQILPIIEPPPDRAPETIHQATQAYTRIIENQIRQHPDQWIWLHRRWKTQPLAGSGNAGA